jgi:hypothetical protein
MNEGRKKKIKGSRGTRRLSEDFFAAFDTQDLAASEEADDLHGPGVEAWFPTAICVIDETSWAPSFGVLQEFVIAMRAVENECNRYPGYATRQK